MNLSFSKLVVLAMLITFTSFLSAFSVDKPDPVVSNAIKEFKALRYDNVIKLLKPYLEKNPENVNAMELIADSYRKLANNYDQVVVWYEKLTSLNETKPEWALYYAEALASKERYEESENWYRKYLALVPADKRATSFISTNKTNFLKDKGEWNLSLLSLNTQASEFSPIYYKDGLLFSSDRNVGGSVFEFSHFYVIDSLKDVLSFPADSLYKPKAKKFSNPDDTDQSGNDSPTLEQYGSSFTKSFKNKNSADSNIHPLLNEKINKKLNEGTASYLPEGAIIFTGNNYVKGRYGKSHEGINMLKLYTASGENWNKIEDFPYNNSEYSVGHPAVNTKGDVLILTSDKPGGYGGTDLYYCVRPLNGQWGKMVNMGNIINTEGNEMFPYLDKDDKLYFSSTGYAGLGGLDIFEITLRDMKPTSKPHNLGAPFNSSKDDFGIIKSPKDESGYFTSNRLGSDDIYKFSKSTSGIELRGLMVDATTKLPLAGTIVYRHNSKTDTISTDRKGVFHLRLDHDNDYEVFGNKPGFISSRAFAIAGNMPDTSIHITISMSKAAPPQQFVMEHCDSLKKIFSVQSIYYNLDQSSIRPDAKGTLNSLANLMITHPEISIITGSHCDSRSSLAYNESLSLKRGEEVSKFLVSKGISKSRIQLQYYGKSRIINQCFDDAPCLEVDQQLNRRTEFDIIINGVNLSQLTCRE